MADRYDIQGKPIRIGAVVAVPYTRSMLALGRVERFTAKKVVVGGYGGQKYSKDVGGQFYPEEVAVLEEPVWPNS